MEVEELSVMKKHYLRKQRLKKGSKGYYISDTKLIIGKKNYVQLASTWNRNLISILDFDKRS